MVTTKDSDLAERVRKLRVHGAKIKYYHEMVGGNFRLHELQAAFLRVKLRYLDSALKKRQQNANKLLENLRETWSAVMLLESCVCQGQGGAKEGRLGTIFLPFSCHSAIGEHTWNQFVIRVSGPGQRDALRKRLYAQSIQTEVYYPRALHEQECFGVVKERFPVATRLSQETLALPGLNRTELLQKLENSLI